MQHMNLQQIYHWFLYFRFVYLICVSLCVWWYKSSIHNNRKTQSSWKSPHQKQINKKTEFGRTSLRVRRFSQIWRLFSLLFNSYNTTCLVEVSWKIGVPIALLGATIFLWNISGISVRISFLENLKAIQNQGSCSK